METIDPRKSLAKGKEIREIGDEVRYIIVYKDEIYESNVNLTTMISSSIILLNKLTQQLGSNNFIFSFVYI